jgi:hypothetical protein
MLFSAIKACFAELKMLLTTMVPKNAEFRKIRNPERHYNTGSRNV